MSCDRASGEHHSCAQADGGRHDRDGRGRDRVQYPEGKQSDLQGSEDEDEAGLDDDKQQGLLGKEESAPKEDGGLY